MNLRTYRKAHALTLDQFGALVGASGATVQRWESGKIAIPLWRAIVIEKVTNGDVTPADLHGSGAA